MSSSSITLPTPGGPGSVLGAPRLPTEFTHTFNSRVFIAGEVHLHAVVGGEMPPALEPGQPAASVEAVLP